MRENLYTEKNEAVLMAEMEEGNVNPSLNMDMDTAADAAVTTAAAAVAATGDSITNDEDGPMDVVMSRKAKRKWRKRESLEEVEVVKRQREVGDNTAEDEAQAARQDSEPAGRKRLYFPSSCDLTQSQKRLWSAKLAQDHRSYKPTLKEGVNRAFITVEEDAVLMLTTEGYRGVVMEQPKEGDKMTKVFIAPYDLMLDPELLMDDDRVVWARRHVVKGEAKRSVVAMVRGDVPEKLHVLGNGYRKVYKFIERAVQCFNCNRWNHKAWKCEYEVCCRYCARHHPSSQCLKKIQDGEIVAPRCCNCGKEHNATSKVCDKRPRINSATEKEKITYKDAPAPTVNFWEGRSVGGGTSVVIKERDESGQGSGSFPTAQYPRPCACGGGGGGLLGVGATVAPVAPATESSASAHQRSLADSPDELRDLIHEMRQGFKLLCEKVDSLQKKYDALKEEIHESKDNKVETPRPAMVAEAAPNSVSAKSSKAQSGKSVRAKHGEAQQDACGDVEVTPQYIKQKCQALEKVMASLIMSTTKEKITRSNLWSAVIEALDVGE